MAGGIARGTGKRRHVRSGEHFGNFTCAQDEERSRVKHGCGPMAESIAATRGLVPRTESGCRICHNSVAIALVLGDHCHFQPGAGSGAAAPLPFQHRTR